MEPKRSQAIGIFITSLHLSAADIETALLSFDASLLPLETLQSLFEHVSAVSEHGGGACEGGGGQAMTRVSLRFGVATLLQCGDWDLSADSYASGGPAGAVTLIVCCVSVLYEHDVNVSVTMCISIRVHFCKSVCE